MRGVGLLGCCCCWERVERGVLVVEFLVERPLREAGEDIASVLLYKGRGGY